MSGGTAPFTYLWDDPSNQTSVTAINLCNGIVNVTITDSLNCTASASTTINEPTALSNTTSSINASCGGSDGSATVVVSGGTGPYTYLWDDPALQTNGTADSLFAGTYTVLITDANGCMDSTSVSVSNAGGPTAVMTNTDVLCNGGSDGTATVTTSGGSPPMTYLWNDPGNQSNATATGLSAGTFNVTVTDSAGCLSISTATVIEPAAIALSLTSTQASSGNDDGAIDLTVSGGIPPYAFNWSNGALTEDLDSLAAGTYTVTVMDSNGCTSIDSATVTTIIGINESELLRELSIFPNPNTGKFNVVYELSERQFVTISVYSVTGQTIFYLGLLQPKGEHLQLIDIEGEATGLYNLRIVFENDVINKVLVID